MLLLLGAAEGGFESTRSGVARRGGGRRRRRCWRGGEHELGEAAEVPGAEAGAPLRPPQRREAPGDVPEEPRELKLKHDLERPDLVGGVVLRRLWGGGGGGWDESGSAAAGFAALLPKLPQPRLLAAVEKGQGAPRALRALGGGGGGGGGGVCCCRRSSGG